MSAFKGTLEQRLAFGVLVAWARTSNTFDVYCRHCGKETDTAHAKGCVVPEAVAILGLKDAHQFNKRTYRFKRPTPPVPRTDPASFPPLGENQLSVLKSLDRGPWHERCGWLWDTPSGTRKILDSLVKRGLVAKEQTPKGTEWRKL